MGSLFAAIPRLKKEFEHISGVRARPDIALVADLLRAEMQPKTTNFMLEDVDGIDASSIAVILQISSEEYVEISCSTLPAQAPVSSMRCALLDIALPGYLHNLPLPEPQQFPLVSVNEESEHGKTARNAQKCGLDGDRLRAAEGFRAASRLAAARRHFADSAEYLDAALLWETSNPSLYEDRAAAYARIERHLASSMWALAAKMYARNKDAESSTRCRVLGLRAQESFADPSAYISLGTSGSGAWATYAMAIGHSLRDEHGTASRVAQAAVDQARQIADMQLLARACELAALGFGYSGRLDHAIRYQREAIDAIIAERIDDREVRARANLIDMLLEQLHMDSALEESAALLSRCRTLELTREMPVALGVRIRVLVDSGRCTEAGEIEPELRAMLAWSSPGLRTDFARYQLARAAAILGREEIQLRLEESNLPDSYQSFGREASIARLWQMLGITQEIDSQPCSSIAWEAEPTSAAEHDVLLVRLKALGADVDLERLALPQRSDSLSPFQRRAVQEIRMAITPGADVGSPVRMWQRAGFLLDALLAEVVGVMRDENYARLPVLRATAAALGAGGICRAIQCAERLHMSKSVHMWPQRSVVYREPVGCDALLQAATYKKVRRGETFIPTEDARLAIVVSGRLLLGGSLRELRTIAIDIVERGDTVGEEHLVSQGSALAAEALIDTELAVVSEQVFDQLIQHHDGLRSELLSEYAWRMHRAASLAGEMTVLDSDHRFARLALMLDDRFGRDRIDGTRLVERAMTQEELGRLIGVSRKSIVRALHTLREARILTLDKRRLHILNRERLTAFISESQIDEIAA